MGWKTCPQPPHDCELILDTAGLLRIKFARQRRSSCQRGSRQSRRFERLKLKADSRTRTGPDIT
eukprot:6201931-Pleurochrysis_carterae.AAC.1